MILLSRVTAGRPPPDSLRPGSGMPPGPRRRRTVWLPVRQAATYLLVVTELLSSGDWRPADAGAATGPWHWARASPVVSYRDYSVRGTASDYY